LKLVVTPVVVEARHHRQSDLVVELFVHRNFVTDTKVGTEAVHDSALNVVPFLSIVVRVTSFNFDSLLPLTIGLVERPAEWVGIWVLGSGSYGFDHMCVLIKRPLIFSGLVLVLVGDGFTIPKPQLVASNVVTISLVDALIEGATGLEWSDTLIVSNKFR